MGVRGTEVVLAPRGETGSFTQMPPTSLLYSHQPAKLNLSNSLNLDPTFSDPSILVSTLSSLKKLLLPGTLRLGPLSHVDTFFVDCGADDLFMDSKLAADLQIPLLELSTPITLRLADGDSSSSLTHRTVPLQLHIGNHVETATFYVADLCHGFILGYSWLERHNPRINWVSRMVEFDSSYCLENCCVVSSRIQGLGKPPDTSKTFELPLAPNTILTPVDLSPISCSLPDPFHLAQCKPTCIPLLKHHQFPMSVYLRTFCPVFLHYFQRTRPKLLRRIETSTALSISSPVVSLFMARSTSRLVRKIKSCKNGSIQDFSCSGMANIKESQGLLGIWNLF
ncbi:hypothetical protein BASA50_005077 [Batrachochytrium salamandrivorans]|uniref:Peptidase A2 domain-containing protein n=1 Tax=Batrachochytrium salamandrivorans TaxID=1357716 RepID=A0ABQ8FDQ1_9FUNG|nr:hypothetical protein BASA50_005077 [Batrachochytrium salamandrivorans]